MLQTVRLINYHLHIYLFLSYLTSHSPQAQQPPPLRAQARGVGPDPHRRQTLNLTWLDLPPKGESRKKKKKDTTGLWFFFFRIGFYSTTRTSDFPLHSHARERPPLRLGPVQAH